MNLWQQLGPLLLVAAALFSVLFWFLPQFRATPEDRERRRRLDVNAAGRIADAEIMDVQDDAVFYSYSVGGVAYAAAQDVSQLREFLPQQPERMIGPVMLKYAPNNPANSILVCERWSGLRSAAREKTLDSVPS